MTHAIDAVLARAVEAGVAPGFSAAAVMPDGSAFTTAAGVRGADNPAPMTADTVFWVASCTKAVTAAAALQLVEAGKVTLDEPLGDRLPGLAAPKVLAGFGADGTPILKAATAPVTLRRLLTHTSGLAYEFCHADLARAAEALGVTTRGPDAPDLPLVFEPGSGWQYGVGLDWAARLVEAVSGEPFADYLAAHVLRPLGMADTGFFPDEAATARTASMHHRQADGGLVAAPFAMSRAPYFAMGGGGLYSTAPDYLRFLRAILGGGAPILNSGGLALMTANQVGDMAAGTFVTAAPEMSSDFDPLPGVRKGWSLGFLVNLEPGPDGRSAGSLAWGGLSNCYYWADPARGVAGVLFAQLLPFADPRVLDTFGAFERAVYS